MRQLMLIAPLLLPILFWAWYHYYKDRHQPEPLANLAISLLLGVGSFFLGKLGYELMGLLGLRFDAYELAAENLVGLFVYATLVIGGIEETAKLIPFLVVVLRFKAFDENLDGIIYASFIALGFAAAENIHYMEFLSSDELIYRGFAGPLVHIVFASVWGYYVGINHLAGQPVALVAFVAVTAAALLHGVYDFLVIAFPMTALPLAAALIAGVWVWRLVLIRRLNRADGHII